MKTITGTLALALLLLTFVALGCAVPAEFKHDASSAAGDSGDDSSGGGEILPDGAEAVLDDVSDDTDGATPEVTTVQCELDEDCVDSLADVDFPCHLPTCSDDGLCEWEPVDDDEDCDDGNDCTSADSCQGGKCIGDPLVCDDGAQPCVSATCVVGEGCVEIALSGPCDDGDPCTQGDQCADKVCEAGTAVSCDDANPCTQDGCDSGQGGCVFVDLDGDACNDSNPCTLNESCQNGSCVSSTWDDCASLDDEECQIKLCDPGAGGCGYVYMKDESPCDDHNPCTMGDICVGGTCSGATALPCEDADPCTTDGVCDPGVGCVFNPAPGGTACDDHNPCTELDVCTAGDCRGTTVTCDDDNACTFDYCDPLLGGCVFEDADGLACDDGNPCSMFDQCQAGACTAGPPKLCDDNNDCTSDKCILGAQGQATCNHEPKGFFSCNDNNPCTSDDLCQPGLGTCSGKMKACDDGNPCSDDFCDATDGECKAMPTADGGECVPENPCIDEGACQQGFCTGELRVCDDTDSCTVDSCDTDTGDCVFELSFDPGDSPCRITGVCTGLTIVDCEASSWICEYDAVPMFEDEEQSCDGLDNDCDGLTDEGLCGVCSKDQRFCSGDDVFACNSAGSGWTWLKACATGNQCLGDGICLPSTPTRLTDSADFSEPPLLPGAESWDMLIDAAGYALVAFPAGTGETRSLRVERMDLDAEAGSAPSATSLLDVQGAELIGFVEAAPGSAQQLLAYREPGETSSLTIASIEGEGLRSTHNFVLPQASLLTSPLRQGIGSLLVASLVQEVDGDALSLRVERLDLDSEAVTLLLETPYEGATITALQGLRALTGDLVLLFDAENDGDESSWLQRVTFGGGEQDGFQAAESVVIGSRLQAASRTASTDMGVLVYRNADGALDVHTRQGDAFAAADTETLGVDLAPGARVHAFPYADKVLALYDGLDVDQAVVLGKLVGEGGDVAPALLPPMAGMDGRYGTASSAEWYGWRNELGEIHLQVLTP